MVGMCSDGSVSVLHEHGVSLFDIEGVLLESVDLPRRKTFTTTEGTSTQHGSVFASTGSIIHLFGPFGIAEDGNGGVAVVDYHHDRVQSLESSGHVFSSMPIDGGQEQVELPEPCGVVVDGAGQLLFSCSQQQCVCVYPLPQAPI